MCLKVPPTLEPPEAVLNYQTTHYAPPMMTENYSEESCPPSWELCGAREKESCMLYGTRLCCYQERAAENRVSCLCITGYEGEQCEYLMDESRAGGLSPDWVLIIIFLIILFILIISLVTMFIICRKRRSRTQSNRRVDNNNTPEHRNGDQSKPLRTPELQA